MERVTPGNKNGSHKGSGGRISFLYWSRPSIGTEFKYVVLNVSRKYNIVVFEESFLPPTSVNRG